MFVENAREDIADRSAPTRGEDRPATYARQRTLKSAISCTGIALHSGQKVTMTLQPAPADTGIVFRRTDIAGRNAEIPALWNAVADSRLCTVIANDQGVTVATIEHLMAALAGCGLDNAVVELNGPEVPIMDGSSAPFVFLVECAGTVEQDATRKVIRIRREVAVRNGETVAALTPGRGGLTVDFEIDFTARAIGRQRDAFLVTPATFKQDIARARTFGMLEDIPKMRAAGLGLGGSLDNAVVVNDDQILNEDGLRFGNEFVRHKILDAVGDLALAGHPIVGRFHGVRSSHAHNNKLLRALFADRSAWTLEPLRADEAAGAAVSAAAAAPVRLSA
ncbi:MAG: UDP-3-O-acyl-N-acetylglucosamine deacetylase [Caenispirillum bisanense]|nr:UDP-3-O-acyl-N-acetylglucosamine deacetylase [Caenispirillum bisanense]MCA1971642.1 UDP-3-O-acyl-N-acetylglucosamine deacetylase [Caenispirillum sp.]